MRRQATVLSLPTLPSNGQSVPLEQWYDYGRQLESTLGQLGQWIDAELGRLGDLFMPDFPPLPKGRAADARYPIVSKPWARITLEKLQTLRLQCDIRTEEAEEEEATPSSPSSAMDIDMSSDVQAPPPDGISSLLLRLMAPPPEKDPLAEMRTLFLPRELDCHSGNSELFVLDHLLYALHVYYMDAVAENATFNSVFSFNAYAVEEDTRVVIPTTQDDPEHAPIVSQTSFHTLIFLEMLHLRVLRQAYCEMAIYTPPADGSDGMLTTSSFKLLIEQLLVLDNPSIAIVDYTQSEVEQALLALMFKFHHASWSSELHHYVHTLLDRLAVLVCTEGHTSQVLNMEHFRRPSTAPNTVPARYRCNFDFLYRCQWRYYHVINSIVGFEIQLAGNGPSTWFTKLPTFDDLAVNQAEVAVQARLLQMWFTKRIASYTAMDVKSLVQMFTREILSMLVPRGDAEWAHYKMPVVPQDPTSLLETLHPTRFKSMMNQIMVVPTKYANVFQYYTDDAVHGSDKSPFRHLHDLMLLYVFNRHLLEPITMTTFGFRERYVIPQAFLHVQQPVFAYTSEPYLVQWLGRFYLAVGEQIYLHTTNIVEILAHWLVIMKRNFPVVWAEVLPCYMNILSTVPTITLPAPPSTSVHTFSFTLPPSPRTHARKNTSLLITCF